MTDIENKDKDVGRNKAFDYDEMVQAALRGVVRNALQQASKEGLSGRHHFYITFESSRPDVKVPEYLRKQHPEEITIVLQHQFWDLKVDDKGFSVLLSFNEVQERIEVSYAALISFLDPSVKFGLQFEPSPPASPEKKTKKEKAEEPTKVEENKKKVVELDTFRNKK
ncbi:MAG: hypothetical protein J0H12_02695 [Candidatus Paracaedimonas acanthamoebae]|uniref:Stringent starvation protein B n=1 Tax=Candidatus Paracaedimonas acanthamoebae TaxID=244581 RepID=A0A8J7TU48_9PROT|nr:hypothetical protein [Candidatus Paracaedimonas acanthamoebae]